MAPTESKAERLAETVSKERLKLFAKLLKKHITALGVDSDLFDTAERKALTDMQAQPAYDAIVAQAVQSEENRGIDSIGRILVEYCFFRSPSVQMLWPEDSDEDMQARREFLPGVIPRPLMRYFLVSVRGTIRELDGFASNSMLFGDAQTEYEQLHAMVSTHIEQFKGPFGSGESAVDWEEVYNDPRFQAMALKLIKGMLQKFKDNGLEGYLTRLENYQSLDPQRSDTNTMYREFSMEDARQIAGALEFAEGVLWQLSN